MTGIRNLIRRWQITHYESQRLHRQEHVIRSRVMVGAYGLADDHQTPAR